jgi:RHS repeat-associated protein
MGQAVPADEPLAIIAGSGGPSQTNYLHCNRVYSVAALTNSSGTVVERYRYGSYVNEPLAIISSSGGPTNTKYLHDNIVYSVAAMTDSTGTVVERYRYDPYGARTVLEQTGASLVPPALAGISGYDNRLAFAGSSLDVESGEYFGRARYFDPALGNFLGRDPSGYRASPISPQLKNSVADGSA